jgi:hypothetical protein
MPRTILTPTLVPKDYATDGVLITFTAWDSTNGNRFQCTGRELLIARNVSTDTARTVTITSQPDDQGRTGNITADSLAFGTMHVYPLFPLSGWADTSGYIAVDGSAVDIQFAVLRIP